MPDQDTTPSGPPDPPDRPGDGDRPRYTERNPVEEDPAVQRSLADDNTATALTGEEREDRGPLAPSFRAPGEPAEREPGEPSRREPSPDQD